MIEPDAPTRGPRWPFYCYRWVGFQVWKRRRHRDRALTTGWRWRVIQWTFRQRDPRRWEYEREQTGILVLASLLVVLAIWWLVGMP